MTRRSRVGAAAVAMAAALGTGGCIEDPDCGICDPHQLVLQSISGVNYGSRKIHLLDPACEGERCPGNFGSGTYFIAPIGPCETSEEALASPRGPQEWCRLSPLVTAFGIEFVFNNLLDPTSVELVRRRPDNPQLFEVYDWKTQILEIQGPITRFNGDFHLGATGDPDRVTRMVNLSCIDNLRDQGRTLSAAELTDPVGNPCNALDEATGMPMKLRVDGTVKATRGQWDSRALSEGAPLNCSNPDSGPDTCCSECDFILSTQLAKYGVFSATDSGSGSVLEGADLLRSANLRRPADGSALECDVDGDPLQQCRDFVVAVDRTKETRSYEYSWSCDAAADASCSRQVFRLPYYDRLRETHPEQRPAWAEGRTARCQRSADC
ncbi:MAG: hypothetical protein K0V04_07640, partial [Deltaproteobacteria bacterium]|nr:hypothetical protein [Deltaproteobacteria bacterium]